MQEDILGVVIDAGSQNTKAGFAGEPSPRIMIPTTVGRFRKPALHDGVPPYYCGNEAIKNRGISKLVWPVQEGMITDWDEVEKLWHHIFFKELHVPPENSKVMYAVHPLVAREDMARISEILFESFAIHGLYMAKSPVLVLYASGRTSGVVWEDGHACSYVAPVFEGFHLQHSTVKFPITGQLLTERLQQLLFKLGYPFTTPYELDLMDQIKKDICYVALDYETELASIAGYSDCKVRYNLPDGQHIMLGEERFQVAEAMLQPTLAGHNCKNLVDSIIASIDLCDEDYRFRKPALHDGVPPCYCGNEPIKNRGISKLVWPVQEGMITDWDEVEKLWHHIFFKELHVPPENSKVMYAVHPLVARVDMARISEILFESFAIHGLYMAKSPVLVLYASGRTAGVVWEDGHACSYVAPVFEGFHLQHSTVKFPITGQLLTERLQQLLFKLGYSFTTPYELDLMDQIKKDICYVALDYETELACIAGYSDCKVRYNLPDGQHIMLGEERFQVAEAMLQPTLAGHNCKNLVDSIIASIDLCDEDYRKIFFKNIVFSGGSSLFPGLVDRVMQDLTHDLRSGNIRPTIDAMAMRQYAAWAGGSMMASMSVLNGFWMTKAEYEDAGSDIVKFKFF